MVPVHAVEASRGSTGRAPLTQSWHLVEICDQLYVPTALHGEVRANGTHGLAPRAGPGVLN